MRNRGNFKVKRWLGLLISGLVAIGVYLPTLGFQFVWDDINLIVYNQDPPLRAFGQSFWAGSGEHLGSDPYYRPLANFSLRLDRLIAGRTPWFFHLVNILLHASVCVLFALLIFMVTGSWKSGQFAALFLALHPLFADCVAYVSGRTDLLTGLGLLIACLGLIEYMKKGGWVNLILVLAGFALAVFSKESGLFFILIVLIWILFKGKVKRCGVVLAGVAVIAAIYLFARYQVLGSLVGMKAADRFLPLIITGLNSFGQQLSLLFFPFNRVIFYWSSGDFVRLNVWGVIGLVYLFLPLLFLRLKQRFYPLLGWFWSVVFLLPVAVLAPFGPSGRLLYLPALGVLLMLVAVARLIATRPIEKRVLVVVAVCLSVFFIPFLWRRMRLWQNEERLFLRMVKEAPDYAPGHYNLGSVLLKKGDETGAIAHYRRAVALDSGLSVAGFNLAALLQRRGEYEEAEMLLRRVIRDKPGYAQAYANLALIVLNKGDLALALDLQKKSAELAPADPNIFYNLALLFRRKGELDSARKALGRAIELDPRNPRFRSLWDKLQ